MTKRAPDPTLAELLHGQWTPLDDATVADWRARGWWEGRTIRSLLTDTAAQHPDRLALIGHRFGGPRETRTYEELDRGAHDAANRLASLGVGSGDSVAIMLPNWVEYPELVFGINELGAVYAAIPVGYGELQAAAILRRSNAKVLVIPRRWRSAEHLAFCRRLRQQLVHLEHIVVVGDDAGGLQDGEVSYSALADAREHDAPAPHPGQVCYLGFTSGTTGEPKGAMHSHESLVHSARRLAEHVGPPVFGDPMVHLVASPVGHHTGFVWGIVFTVMLAGTGVHVDRWEPAWGVEIIRRERVTTFFGAPTFLQDMMRTDLAGDPGCPLTCLVIAGAPVPRGLPEQAGASLGAYVCPAWGMTECSIVCSCTPSEASGIQGTDGSVLGGSEVRVLDDDGRDVPTGVVGELVVRGPSLLYGYFDREDATREAFLPGRWLRTGDRASVDEHGWVSLRGRSKDIIIRGGENIPVTDVESLMFEHPDVANAALVGIPDERLGERICAVLVVKDGARALTQESLAAFLLDRGLSKHHLPERVVCVGDLPMTASGKIQKFRLREIL